MSAFELKGGRQGNTRGTHGRTSRLQLAGRSMTATASVPLKEDGKSVMRSLEVGRLFALLATSDASCDEIAQAISRIPDLAAYLIRGDSHSRQNVDQVAGLRLAVLQSGMQWIRKECRDFLREGGPRCSTPPSVQESSDGFSFLRSCFGAA